MDINKHKTVAFSGYRKSKIINNQTNTEQLTSLRKNIYNTLTELASRGYDTFLCGMSDGFDLMCGEQVLTIPNLKLVAVIPYPSHNRYFDDTDKDLYTKIIHSSSSVITLSDSFKGNFLYLERNDYMLANCSVLVCYYDGEKGGTKYTYNKATKKGINIINLCPHNKIPQQLSLLG